MFFFPRQIMRIVIAQRDFLDIPLAYRPTRV
jgi:hypothetical protein